MNTRGITSFLACALLSLLPIFAYAQPTTAPGQTTLAPATSSNPYAFQRDGIFSCNRSGASAMSVGAIAATGGVYVPVADATVQLNTGMLVYKECVLRELIVRTREAAMTALTRKAVVAIQTGRSGNAQYVVDEREEMQRAKDKAFAEFFQGGTLQNLNTAFQPDVMRAVLGDYETQTRAPERALRCEYQGDLRAASKNPTQTKFTWDNLGTLKDPACNPLGAYYLARQMAENVTAQCEQYLQGQWDKGRGYYPITDDPTNPCYGQIVLPAVNVQESFQRLLDSPVYQMENANDIGQMIGALYSGLTTQIMSDNQGLAGLMQSVGGQPSYLNQLTAESAQGVRNSALNIALQILSAARQVEVAYFTAVNAILSTLTQTSGQLKNAENQCWNLIIPQVCAGTLDAQNKCTDSGGATYQVATSTAGYAQAIIASQITSLVAPTVAKATSSQNALFLIDQLIQGISNTASQNAQRLALQQLDSLVSQRLLHVSADVDGPTGVQKQLDDTKIATRALMTRTVEAWANDPSPSVGWCNINNPAVIQGWKDRWKQ